MASIMISASCSVSFTDEEKEVLRKASEICKNVGNEIWHDGNGTNNEDIAAFFFAELGENLQHALKGDW